MKHSFLCSRRGRRIGMVWIRAGRAWLDAPRFGSRFMSVLVRAVRAGAVTGYFLPLVY